MKKIKGMDLKLTDGIFEILYGDELEISDNGSPLLIYIENGILYVEVSPDKGMAYDVKIILPHNLITEFIKVSLNDGALHSDVLNTGSFDIDIKNSSCEIKMINARRVNAQLGKGNAVINARPLISADFNCGMGSMTVNLDKNNRGYFISAIHGKGSIKLNSSDIPREYKCGTENGAQVSLRCGMGELKVNYM